MFGSLKATSGDNYRFSNNYVDLPVGMRKGKTWRQRLIPETIVGKVALAFMSLQALITLVLEIVITVFHIQQMSNAGNTHYSMDGHMVAPNSTNDAKGSYMEQQMRQSESVIVYHYIFMSAQFFLVAMTWDAIMRKNTLQLIGICLLLLLFIAYTYIQSNQHANMNMDDIKHLAETHHVFVHNTIPYEMTLIAITAAGSIFMAAITWELYRDFGWKIYKKLGADLQISRMYRLHQITLTYLKFDAFFFIAFSVQIVILSLKGADSERYIQVTVAIPLSVLMICLAMFAIHKESKPLLILYLLTLVIGFGYLIYKLVDISITERNEKDPYIASRKFLYFFVLVTLALGVISAIYSILCYRYFGRGLIEHRRQHKLGRVAAPVSATDEEARRISLMHRQEMNANRMELD
ncbi:hypothetical protein BDF19DRAFT_431901 [Syncephalis fuscata]|nr:hypothetical protein BDF19DRAFT_431901 [Syncephalis fuscata]